MTETLPKYRALGGVTRGVEATLLIALTVVGAAWAGHVHHYWPWALYNEQYLGLFLGLGLAPVFLVIKAGPRAPHGTVAWYDWIACAAALAVGLYVALLYPRLAYSLAILTWDKLLFGTVCLVLVLEAVRRVAGWALMGIALACILYAKFAWMLPGLLYARGSGWGRITAYLYLDTNGILGVPLAVTASIVIAYILFGQALYAVGGDRFLTGVALALMGRYRGGAAKMAVVSSTLYGTVSGSAVANVVVDGAVTIPMMKRAGYPPHLAAAIEAVASNGGQLMPPVMGAAAFLMAEYLGLPYGQIALAALVPALLYYLALFVQIDLEAARLGLHGLPASELPRLRDVMGRGWVFVVPLGVLTWTLMFAGWEAGKAGMLAVVVTFAVGGLRRETRPTLGRVVAALEGTGRTMLELVAIVTLAGIVIGSLQLSGLVSKLPILLVSMAGGDVLLLLLLTAIVSIVLGMSLPTTVVYITLAVLIAPALAQMGVDPLAAHLFLFYFGMLSLITPPDCLATYAAAAIAKADFWQTGWTGMRLGIVAYVVPFVFVLHPALILHGGAGEIALALVTTTIGVILLSIGCAGFLYRPLGWAHRTWAIVAGMLLVLPPADRIPGVRTLAGGRPLTAALVADTVGLALGLTFVLVSRAAAVPGPVPVARMESRS
ncbi:MAG: TRAP transporter fused permease subunit [Candidatus Rokubacteria bacterium]|nr:TRAP transporter fused permease subunit [Candidatus Rokubacteria bacterium]